MPKSVVQLISSGGFYGAEQVVLELASFLKNKGWRSHIGVIESPGSEEFINRARNRKLETHIFSNSDNNFISVINRMKEYIKKNDIDIIHSHGYKTDVYSFLIKKPQHVRRIATCHTWYSDSIKLKFYEWVDKQVLKRFDFVAVVSPQLLQDIRCVGILSTRSTMIVNGISAESSPEDGKVEKLRLELGIESKVPMILRIGRLSISKGNEVLLKAMCDVVPYIKVQLIFVGEGENEGTLRKLVKQYQLDKSVIFAGYRRDVTDLLHGSDICCISSLEEGLPIVLLEAMAARIPLVTTSVGAIPSVIRNGDNGWLVPPNESKMLSSAILDALFNREKATAMASQAYKDFQMFYSQEAMGEKYVEIYNNLFVK